MRILIGILFWTLAALEGLWLLFMLIASLAAGPRMAENGDMWSPIFTNILLPLALVTGAILLFALTRSPVTRGLALLVVLAPVVWLFAAPVGEGNTVYTRFVDPAANDLAGGEAASGNMIGKPENGVD
ncbi:MAG: hypothetical protein KF780_03315 [Sphingomonas sp.]|nr:hypothetical protein [Sphingomonas sp.]